MTDSNMNNDSPTYSQNQCPLQEECILAAKIFDGCRLQECTRQGPAISNENCVCTLIHPVIPTQNTFGSIIYPAEPIRLPKWIKQIKYVKNSFLTKKVMILSILPSPVRRGYWDVEMEFVFDFEIRLYGDCQTPVEVICQPCVNDPKAEYENRKSFLRCSTSYRARVTLMGPKDNSPAIASDVLPSPPCSYPNSPHAFVELRAEPVDFKLVDPNDAGCYRDLFDDTYHEPFCYVYAYIAMMADIKLFGFVSLAVDAKRCAPPKNCCNYEDDPCSIFAKMPFPVELFQP